MQKFPCIISCILSRGETINRLNRQSYLSSMKKGGAIFPVRSTFYATFQDLYGPLRLVGVDADCHRRQNYPKFTSGLLLGCTLVVMDTLLMHDVEEAVPTVGLPILQGAREKLTGDGAHVFLHLFNTVI